eukprot:6175684-Pleurochrysis_carterae.AAC.2
MQETAISRRPDVITTCEADPARGVHIPSRGWACNGEPASSTLGEEPALARRCARTRVKNAHC